MKEFLAVILAVVLLIGGMLVGMQALAVAIHRVPVKVFVDGKEVYHGINACVEIDSAGSATIVHISGGPLCLFPMARYVSRDVREEGDRR
jgi:hypothetical protein